MDGKLRVTASMLTDQGRVRNHNEDFIDCYLPESEEEQENNGALYIVADGVGGAHAGEIASRFATERTIHHYLANPRESDHGVRLMTAMQLANQELRQLASDQQEGKHMATTMVATVLHGAKATIANVGDSRGYLLQNGALTQITKDQSLVAKLVEEGAITEDEARSHPRKNVILHSLGAENSPEIDLYEIDLKSGNQLVLCSDGLVRHVSNEEIAAIITTQSEDAVNTLVKLANERGGEDNITVAVLRIGEQPAEDATEPAFEAVSGIADRQDSRMRGGLWVYTAILTVIQSILIIIIWYLVNG